MSTILERIKNNFSDSIQIKINCLDILLPTIGLAGEKIVQALLDGHKILCCGNGGSACEALRFSSHMLNRFKHERPGLPTIALNADIATMTAISNDYHFQDIFAKQIRALGQPGDILLAISINGNSANILNAIKAAHDRQMNVVALTGHDGGRIGEILQSDDTEIRINTTESARVQETHLVIIHCLCDIVDFQLFGHGETI